MALSDVYLVSDKLDLATDSEVAAAEQELGTRLPTGYRAYVMILGAGTLNDTIRLVMPADIVRETQAFHETDAIFAIDDTEIYNLFESGLDLLPPERMRSAVLFGTAHDSNRLVFHPDMPDDLFLIDDAWVFALGHSIEDAISWILEGEPYGSTWRSLAGNGEAQDSATWYFEPEGDRERLTFDLKGEMPYAEVRAYLMDLKRQQPDRTLLIGEQFPDEDDAAVEHEIAHLFLQECGGAVWCSDVRAEPEGITIHIAYDRNLPAARLDQLTAFCRSHALRMSQSNGIVTVL